MIIMLFALSFFGRHSDKLSMEFKLLMPGIAASVIFIAAFLSKMVSVISIDKFKKELSIEYYRFFRKHTVSVDFSQFSFRINAGSHKNSYLKLVLNNGNTYTASDKHSGTESIDYDRLLEVLKEIKPLPPQIQRRKRRRR